VQNYREVCERFKCPSNPTIFSDYLMTRNQSHFDMRGRGLSTIGLKALCCAMYSRAPDFDQIRKLLGGGGMTQYLIKNPEETFKVSMGVPDVFTLRREQLCVQMSVLDLSENDFRAQGCQDLVEVIPQILDTKPQTLDPRNSNKTWYTSTLYPAICGRPQALNQNVVRYTAICGSFHLL